MSKPPSERRPIDPLGQVFGGIARRLTGGSPRILFYHRVGDAPRALGVKEFEAQLRFLRRHFQLMRLVDLVRLRRDGALPPLAAAITVDDGYADFAAVAYPLLRHYRIPATVFLVSDFAAGGSWLWFDRLRYVCEKTPLPAVHVSLNGAVQRVDLSDGGMRHQGWDMLATWLLRQGLHYRECFLRQFAAAAQVSLPERAPEAYRAMSWQELRRLDPALIDVGAHTRTHSTLAFCSAREQWQEIAGSKADLEAALDRPVQLFCYPNGQAEDLDARTTHLVRRAGFLAAVTSVGRLVEPQDEDMLLPRLCGGPGRVPFRRAVNGFARCRRWLRGGS